MLNKIKELRDFAQNKFGNLKGLANAMDITPQHLQAYLRGDREWGASFREKLVRVGFYEPIKQSNITSFTDKTNIPIDINGTVELTNTPIERLALLIGVPKETIESWQDGTASPNIAQLSKLCNQIVALGIASKSAIKDNELHNNFECA